MSKSRSSTPTPHPAATSTTTTADTTITAPLIPPSSSSRLEISNDPTDSTAATTHGTALTTPHQEPSQPLLFLRPITELEPSSPLAHPRPTVSTPSPMARRFPVRMSAEHRTSATAPARPSSASSDSQGGMADTEMEGGQSQQSEERSPPRSAPPKKKRTRTLTTPHQAQVLHALLAQSRFPSTAMREEVGRSIGLSARKVQIWFQNQRQKARRPRSQSAQPASRPPQFGPFPNQLTRESDFNAGAAPAAPGPGAPGHHVRPPYVTYENISPRPHSDDQAYHAQQPHHEAATSVRLAGPGIPGESHTTSFLYREHDRQRPSLSLEIRSPVRHAPYPDYATRHPTIPSPHTTHPPPRSRGIFSPHPPPGYRDPNPRPSTSSMSFDTRRMNDPSRTLPPLVFPPSSQSHIRPTSLPSSSVYGGGAYTRTMHLPYLSPSNVSASPTDTLFAHRPPPSSLPPIEDHPSTSATPARPIPPPFALQPPPQWDTPSWSAPSPYRSIVGSTYAASPMERRLVSSSPERQARQSSQEASSPEDTRSSGSRPIGGRYDPVRGTVVPYPSPPIPSSASIPVTSYLDTGASSSHVPATIPEELEEEARVLGTEARAEEVEQSGDDPASTRHG